MKVVRWRERAVKNAGNYPLRVENKEQIENKKAEESRRQQGEVGERMQGKQEKAGKSRGK